MSRCKCDWSAEHTPEEFKRITPITHAEEQQIEEMFRAYLIVELETRKTKSIYCTACGEQSYFAKNDSEELGYDPYNDFVDYYRLRHGEQTTCPFCGRTAEIVYAGKMGNPCSKMRQEIKIVVFHAEKDGWLSAQAGYAVKDYNHKEWDTDVAWWPKEQYLFRRGCAMQREAYYKMNSMSGWKIQWAATLTIYEPFAPGTNDWWTGTDGREYDEIGLFESLGNTDMKYSAADQFCPGGEGDFGTIRYLGEYCHRPQLEMITKLELDDISRQLIYYRRSNARLLNWKATNLPGFLRLNKRYTKMFMQSHRSVEELKITQALQRNNCGPKAATEIFTYLSKAGSETVHRLIEAAGDRPITEAVKYLKKQESIQAVHLWIDYIQMAKDLEYDVEEDTVRYPRNLKERHDAATETIKLKQSELRLKKYKQRYKLLYHMYEFTDGEFTVKVPKSPNDIGEEGKALHHCVGTYTSRHFEGKTTILFLRKNSQIDKPYGTIEMSAKNVGNLIQLRGYRNNDIPAKESRLFIAAWLDWVKNRSPRDATGNPIIENNLKIREK